MLTNILSNLNSLWVGLILALNDVFSFGITKEISLGKNIKSKYWLIIPMILYALQILIFNYGLTKTSMSILNITWNLISNVLVTFIGLHYYGEQINNIKGIALGFALVSISLFALDEYYNP
jgi:hypothetical protein